MNAATNEYPIDEENVSRQRITPTKERHQHPFVSRDNDIQSYGDEGCLERKKFGNIVDGHPFRS